MRAIDPVAFATEWLSRLEAGQYIAVGALVVARILPQSPAEEIERLMHRYAQGGLRSLLDELRSARLERAAR